MCLITEQKKPIKIRKDMTVYKIVRLSDDNIRSQHKQFKWTLNYLYATELKASEEPSYMGDKVADIYLSDYFENFVGNLGEFCKHKNYTVIGQGFHSFASINKTYEFYKEWDAVVAKCIIPAGSLIYKDKTGLIVSNQIIMNEILEG